MEYLSPDDLKVAAANGISEDLAKRRFYREGYSKRRAITKKPQRTNVWTKYKDRCAEIGLSQGGFYKRLKKMSPEEASSRPLTSPNGPDPKLTPERRAIAEKNGINYHTLQSRLYTSKWDIERAITEPLDTSKRPKNMSMTGSR